MRSSTTCQSSLFSQSAPTKVPAHPVLEDRLSLAAMPNTNLASKTLNSRPSQMLKTSSAGKLHARKMDPRDQMSRKPPSDAVRHCTGLETFCNSSDTLLPHTKLPAPLPSQHHRNSSEQTLMTPSSLPTATGASKPHFVTCKQLSKARSMRFRSSQQTLDGTPLPDISREQYKMLTQRVQQSLARSNDQITTASSGVSAESTPEWKPPPSWVGPSAVALANGTKEPKPAARSKLTQRKRTLSSPRLGVRERVGSIPERSKTPEPLQLVDIVRPKEDTPDLRGRHVSIRYYEGWREKPVGDVVHMLRELRLK